MENNAIQPLNNTMALSKSSQTDFANNLIKSVTKGEVDPIAAFCQIRGLSDSLSLFLKNEEVKEAVDKAKEKWGSAPAEFHGAKLTITESGVKYDFSVCNDSKWNDLYEQKKEIEALLKEREAFLRGIRQCETVVDEETGEISKLYAPARSASTCVKVTFAK
ncbi:hypothetical protein [uncultured Duncaniella sp.]|uniref:hypothetical protein n=1 Tax=uncultured Duncaniella sp. TaxID=2768039 RepID=UPI0025B0B66E|nr:hypothetical protein [uncultured Duncaniella sp.]